jgi:hypothetical protein
MDSRLRGNDGKSAGMTAKRGNDEITNKNGLDRASDPGRFSL